MLFKLLVYIVTFGILAPAAHAQQVVRQLPTTYDNYRFLGDTATTCSQVTITRKVDMASNTPYYVASKNCTTSQWTRHYGYAQVWWRDYIAECWQQRWQVGYYWTYIPHVEYKEIIFVDIDEQHVAVELLDSY